MKLLNQLYSIIGCPIGFLSRRGRFRLESCYEQFNFFVSFSFNLLFQLALFLNDPIFLLFQIVLLPRLFLNVEFFF